MLVQTCICRKDFTLVMGNLEPSPRKMLHTFQVIHNENQWERNSIIEDVYGLETSLNIACQLFFFSKKKIFCLGDEINRTITRETCFICFTPFIQVINSQLKTMSDFWYVPLYWQTSYHQETKCHIIKIWQCMKEQSTLVMWIMKPLTERLFHIFQTTH